jgi:hypothetical protein
VTATSNTRARKRAHPLRWRCPVAAPAAPPPPSSPAAAPSLAPPPVDEGRDLDQEGTVNRTGEQLMTEGFEVRLEERPEVRVLVYAKAGQ